MWRLSADQLQFFRALLHEDSLNFYLNSNWGSQNPKHRDLIHSALEKNDAFKDFSVSHTRGLGGFAAISSSHKIGFDIEIADRVSNVIAKRVCVNPEEFEEAPSPSHLWVAKEASYKALKGPNQPKVISEVRIGNWKPVLSSDTFSQIEIFQLQSQNELQKTESIGVTFQQNGFIFGVFILVPAFLP